MILVTGGLGFIGGNFVNFWLKNENEEIINVDKLSYASNPEFVDDKNDRYTFVKGDICDEEFINSILNKYNPRAIIHFAAETHVDNSILEPTHFVYTNTLGTCILLNSFKNYIKTKHDKDRKKYRFIYISTDEVYGSLDIEDNSFTEQDIYQPNSPYSASKASADHLVRSFFKTYQLPTIITHCSNNYGPNQNKEKLIPLCVYKAISNKSLPIYGNGSNIRDWIHVEDHCSAIVKILKYGTIGEIYNIGGENELNNKNLVFSICEILDEIKPRPDKVSYKKQIEFVKDRQGHDFRYSINNQKIRSHLNWYPKKNFNLALKDTISWYLSKYSF